MMVGQGLTACGKLLALNSAGAGPLQVLKLALSPRPAAYALGATTCSLASCPQLLVLQAQ